MESTMDDDMHNPSLQDSTGPQVNLTIHHRGNAITMTLPEDSTLADLSSHIAATLSIPKPNQKFLITPKIGLVKPPFDASKPILLPTLTDKKIVLMGSTSTEVSTLSTAISRGAAAANPHRFASGPARPAVPQRTHDRQKALADTTYTFHTLRPLPYLPQPERSLQFLERLRADAGIRAAMLKWRFSVPLLTEMDPAAHTTHESRTLGLNRNAGEVIELRLRTDAGDGYRDYNTIRKTLCHELAHNVWGPHDANFWKLCREIEDVVQRNGGPGRSLDSGRSYVGEDEHIDGGGWTGGEFVVGGRPTAGGRIDESDGMSRRDVLARAAEERLKREKEATTKGQDPSGDA